VPLASSFDRIDSIFSPVNSRPIRGEISVPMTPKCFSSHSDLLQEMEEMTKWQEKISTTAMDPMVAASSVCRILANKFPAPILQKMMLMAASAPRDGWC